MAQIPHKFKRGDIRGDGRIFWCYNKTKKSPEIWVTQNAFEEKQAQQKARYAKWLSKNIEKERERQRAKQAEKRKTEEGRLKCNEATRKWHNANRERLKEYSALKYRENPQRHRDRAKQYRNNNLDLLRAKERQRYLENRETLKEKSRNYYREHPDKCLESRKKWQAKNPDAIKILRKKRLEKPDYAISHRISCLIRATLKNVGQKKQSRTFQILGCSPLDFKQHIESQFLPGMSWENRSEWHLDHIIPVSLGKTKEQILKLNHYTNLRPLWAKENIRKSNKHNGPLPEYLIAA
jgi:hypothetical protein